MVALAYQFQLIFLGCSSLLLLKICCLKNWRLLLATIFCSFFCYYFAHQKIQQLSATVVPTETTLFVQPDTIVVNGDRLQFHATTDKQVFVKVRYRLSTKKEQQVWQMQTHKLVLKVTGQFEAFEENRNLGVISPRKEGFGRNFAGVYVMKQIKTNHPLKSRWSLAVFRRYWVQKIEQRYSKKLASYLKALFFGMKDATFYDHSALYQNTGLIHLFSLSGFHIQYYLGGVALFIGRTFWRRGIRLCLLLLLMGLIFQLTGGSISVLRALISFFIVECTYERVLPSMTALDKWALMIIVCLIMRPLFILTVGGRLSISFCLLLLSLQKITTNRFLQMLLFGLFSPVILLPEFGQWAPFGSLLTFVFMPIFIYLLFPTVVFCALVGLFIPPTSFINHLATTLFVTVEHLLQMLPVSQLVLGKPNLLVTCGLVVLTIYLLHTLQHQRVKQTIVVGSLFLALCWSGRCPFTGMVAFVDVGQGDCIFIRLPFNRETILIDTGGKFQLPTKKWAQRAISANSDYQLVPFLRSQGVSQLTQVVVTHNDQDHMGDLFALSQHIPIKKLVVASGSEKEPKVRALYRKLQEQGTKLERVQAGTVLSKSQALTVLYPQRSKGQNDDSVVSYGVFGGKRFLFTGDLEQEGERALSKQYPTLRVDVLKVGHHGSNTSTSESFVQHIKPAEAIISVGKKNRFNHPTPETLHTLAKQQVVAHRTDQKGMIYYTWLPHQKLSQANWLLEKLESHGRIEKETGER